MLAKLQLWSNDNFQLIVESGFLKVESVYLLFICPLKLEIWNLSFCHQTLRTMFGKQLLSFIMALYIFSSEFQSALAGSTNMFNNFNLITLGFYCHWLSSLRPKQVSNLWSKTTPRPLPNQIPIRLKSQLVPMSPSPTLLGPTSFNSQ